MKKLLVVLALLTAGVVFAQQTQPNLGELAKKEKARRAELEKQGKKARVYTKEDVERVKDKLGIESGSSEAGSGEEAAGANDGSENLLTDEQLKAGADRDEQRQQLQGRLDDLQNQKTDLQKKIDEMNSKTASGMLSVNPTLTLQQSSDLDAQMRELDQQIESVQQQLQDLDQPSGQK
jgi:hypothetical protein